MANPSANPSSSAQGPCASFHSVLSCEYCWSKVGSSGWINEAHVRFRVTNSMKERSILHGA